MSSNRFSVRGIIVALVVFVTITLGVSCNHDFAGSNPEKDFHFQTCNGGVAVTGYKGIRKDVVIPEYIDGKRVVYIGSSMANSRFLKAISITIPDSVTRIGDYAFKACTGLTSVKIGNGVTTIEYQAFKGCTGLTSITIPDSVTSIGREVFKGCTDLTSVTIGNSVLSIGGHVFQDCTGLTSINIPDSVTSIGDGAFKGCSGLTSMKIGNGMTIIDYRAFVDCTGLASITIPASVANVKQDAFRGWTSSQTIHIDKTEAEVHSQWESDWKRNCDATIIYKDSPAN